MRRFIALLVSGLLLVVFVTPAAAGNSSSWHRLNPADPPEHERLSCVGSDVVQCRYNKIPAPHLALGWNQRRGLFIGSEVDADACPAELGDLCTHAIRVVSGSSTYSGAGDPTDTFTQDLIFTDGDGVAPLYQYFVGSFACPWYGSFKAALAANPFPLPYDGTNGPAFDCIPI